MGKNAPPAPNYSGAAQSQAGSSAANVQQQTTANRANQTNAVGGTSQWTQGPDGQWYQNSSFGGPLGSAVGSLQGQAAQNMSTPLDNGSKARDEAIQQVYGSESTLMDPQFRQQQESTDAQLANEGLSPTSEASRNAQNALATQQGQARQQAMANAEQLGNQVQQTTFGENLAARNAPLEELGSLLGLSQQSGYNQAGQAQAEQDLAAAMAQGNYQLPAWEAQNQANADVMQGGGQLISGLMPKMAKGGVTTRPAIVGEAGPEMIVPQGPTTVVPLGGKKPFKPFGYGGKKRHG